MVWRSHVGVPLIIVIALFLLLSQIPSHILIGVLFR
ncbi:hypothetical protein PFWH6_4938 [Pseudomonas fluorescens WH6]|nr:hypothetical protein PFWH6_4938 [Pseudomonas fluorescens WH6]